MTSGRFALIPGLGAYLIVAEDKTYKIRVINDYELRKLVIHPFSRQHLPKIVLQEGGYQAVSVSPWILLALWV